MNGSNVTRRGFLQYGAGAAALAALVTACSGQASPAATQAPANSAAAPTSAAAAAPTTAAAPAATANPVAATGVEIQAATRGGTDGQIMIKTAKTFTDKTGIKVKPVSYGPEPQYESKLAALYVTKQLADVVWSSTC